MKRYFFHAFHEAVARDDHGTLLPGMKEALHVANCRARAIASEQALKGSLNLSHYIVVADRSGKSLGTVTLRHAVEIVG